MITKSELIKLFTDACKSIKCRKKHDRSPGGNYRYIYILDEYSRTIVNLWILDMSNKKIGFQYASSMPSFGITDFIITDTDFDSLLLLFNDNYKEDISLSFLYKYI